MTRACLVVVLAVGLAAAPAQSPTTGPKITVGASGSGNGTGNGSSNVSGSIFLPPPWQLSIHVVTVRYTKAEGGKSLNLLIPVKGTTFSGTMGLKTGSYKVWAVIDVKDADGREKQISSEPQTVAVP